MGICHNFWHFVSKTVIQSYWLHLRIHLPLFPSLWLTWCVGSLLFSHYLLGNTSILMPAFCCSPWCHAHCPAEATALLFPLTSACYYGGLSYIEIWTIWTIQLNSSIIDGWVLALLFIRQTLEYNRNFDLIVYGVALSCHRKYEKDFISRAFALEWNLL